MTNKKQHLLAPLGPLLVEGSFQRCMSSTFSDMLDHLMEVFMDDFSVRGSSFDTCLVYLKKVLGRFQEAKLVLNWEKCHFMVQEGIVLGHKVSSCGIEVDPAKIDVIRNLPVLTTIIGVRSFLGHAEFYRRLIKGFSTLAKPLNKFLQKEFEFHFDECCLDAFNQLKQDLISAPIVQAPDGNLPFELMCDASNVSVGVVRGQKNEGRHQVICYINKTLDQHKETTPPLRKRCW